MTPNNNQPQYGGMLHSLYVPRPIIKFRDLTDIPGVRVESVNSGIETKIKPLVITTGESFEVEGVQSGRRSGLITINGNVYKIKGCRIEEAFEIEGRYSKTRKTGLLEYDAMGGQLLSDAQNEIYWTNIFNEILKSENFPILHEPEAIIHYGKEFLSDMWRHKADDPDELVASVMLTYGDTRLTELFELSPLDESIASEVAYRFGLTAGAQKKLTENSFYWGFQALHAENWAISVKDGVYSTMVDFEDSKKKSFISSNMFRLNVRNLVTYRAKSRVTLENDIILRSINTGRLSTIDYFREPFTRGFNDGYDDPDHREAVTLDMLLEAFDLPDLKLS